MKTFLSSSLLHVMRASGKRFGQTTEHVHFLFIFQGVPLNIFTSCSKQQSVIQQLLSRKGRLIVMCSKGDASAVCPSGSCRVIEVPEVADCLQPVINIIPLQVCTLFELFNFIKFQNFYLCFIICETISFTECIVICSFSCSHTI